MEPGSIFFFTATIHKWLPLLATDEYKKIIISSFEYLSAKGLLDVFAFVIMPNHLHVIWRTNGKNGKETVQGSFLKFTAHTFLQKLKKESPARLEPFQVAASNKSYEFWQRDSLAIHLYSPEIAYQKLDYIHNNPLAKHWNLASKIERYRWSSASYYLENKSEFLFLKDLRLTLHGE